MVNPLLPDLQKFGSYWWVIDQCEDATDLLFKERGVLETVRDDLVAAAMTGFGAPDVLRFLDRKPHPAPLRSRSTARRGPKAVGASSGSRQTRSSSTSLQGATLPEPNFHRLDRASFAWRTQTISKARSKGELRFVRGPARKGVDHHARSKNNILGIIRRFLPHYSTIGIASASPSRVVLNFSV
jgi:hypothetical protein